MRTRVIIIAAVMSAVMLCSCGKNAGSADKSITPVEYSIVSDAAVTDSIESTVNGYLAALAHHSFSELLNYADNELPICIDQTAFEEYVIGLGDATADSIGTDGITENSGEYYVKVRYTLTFTGNYIKQDGTQGIPGSEEHYELFTLRQGDNGLVITTVAPTGEG